MVFNQEQTEKTSQETRSLEYIAGMDYTKQMR